MKPLRTLVAVTIAGILSVSVAACQKEGPAERAGKEIDRTAERAGEKIESATDRAADKIDHAGDKAKEKLDR